MPDELITKIEDLKSICDENYRMCPYPRPWIKMYELLPLEEGQGPGIPLILSAWAYCHPYEKRDRFYAHLECARDLRVEEEVLTYLGQLDDNDWFSFTPDEVFETDLSVNSS